jgi:hypothetical protein
LDFGSPFGLGMLAMEISRNSHRSLRVILITFLLVVVPHARAETTFEQQARLVSGNVGDGYANIGVGISDIRRWLHLRW